MSPRRVHPFSAAHHEAKTTEVLHRYAQITGSPVEMPIPVEMIVETVYDISILWDAIDEPPGERILGFLEPAKKRIVMNQSHEDLFTDVIGPEAFTFAHELGHWVYDADDPAQGQLFEAEQPPVFCRQINGDRTESEAGLREVNANKFAACLLMPADLIRSAVTEPIPSHTALAAQARAWNVSRRALVIRLDYLGLGWAIPDPPA